MTEPSQHPSELTALTDPTNMDLRLVDDEPDEEPGMTAEEADAFLSRPIPPLEA